MNRFTRILLPGLVLQGVVIGGGYATGRELVEYFLKYGLQGAWQGLCLVALIWSALFAVAFVFARSTQSYDYGRFAGALLSRLQYAFDVVLILLMLLIVAVMCSAAGELYANAFGADPVYGELLLALLIIAGVMFPANWLGSVMALWSIVLYAGYGALLAACIGRYGSDISTAFLHAQSAEGWSLSAAGYAAYNLAAIPAVLFTLRGLKSRREAGLAGVIAGVLAVLPCIMMTFILAGFLPEVLESPVPILFVLNELSHPTLTLLMQIAILGTFWQTGVGSLNALNDRIAAVRAPASSPLWTRPLLACLFIGAAWYIGNTFGVVTLVDKGYGYLTFAFIGFFIVPLLTIGVARIFTDSRSEKAGSSV